MRPTSSLIPLLLVLGSCGSPPKPPTVDESLKRPANAAMAVDLQVCKSDLQNTRILATESSRLAESAAATLARVSAQQQAMAAAQAATSTPSPANSVFSIRFGFGSTRVVVPAEAAASLVESARNAPLVLLRGRTDGATDSAAESRIARDRAAAVRDYLVGAGVDAARIRATYQPAGDHAADNSSPAGQGTNRRVEVEVYRALPVAMGSSAAALP
jgi:outer membrane protein OmpA-like peptidoglycan-associated protein